MARRRQADKRPASVDAKFNSTLVSRLINVLMRGGKKATARRIVYDALDALAEKNPGVNTLEILSLIHISETTRRTPISYAVFC